MHWQYVQDVDLIDKRPWSTVCKIQLHSNKRSNQKSYHDGYIVVLQDANFWVSYLCRQGQNILIE